MIKFPDAYDRMLKIQADISYETEKALFCNNSNWRRAKEILDVGCGNGYFTSLMANDFLDKNFYAIEKNETLFNIAKSKYGERINLFNTSYEDFDKNIKFDFVIARLITNQIRNRNEFFNWIFSVLKPGGALLIIDADDMNFSINPTLPIFNQIEQKTKDTQNQIGCRDTKNLILGELESVGFRKHKFLTISPNSLTVDKLTFIKYMYYTLKIEVGDNMPLEIYKELFDWVSDDDSFIQYGMYVALFLKGDNNEQ